MSANTDVSTADVVLKPGLEVRGFLSSKPPSYESRLWKPVTSRAVFTIDTLTLQVGRVFGNNLKAVGFWI